MASRRSRGEVKATPASRPRGPNLRWLKSKPAGALRLAFRLPIYLYRLDLGWLLGHRFLLLVHRGRESGRSLADIGCRSEADAFRGFIERSSAGGAKDLQIMYGVGGERRLTEVNLDHLEGYRGARPVRLGNAASNQLQLDGYGEDRGVFIQSFGSKELDAALLLMPSFEFIAYDDERMVRTTDAVRQELD